MARNQERKAEGHNRAHGFTGEWNDSVARRELSKTGGGDESVILSGSAKAPSGQALDQA